MSESFNSVQFNSFSAVLLFRLLLLSLNSVLVIVGGGLGFVPIVLEVEQGIESIIFGEVLLKWLLIVLVLNKLKDLNPFIFSIFDLYCDLELDVFVRLTSVSTVFGFWWDERSSYLTSEWCFFLIFWCSSLLVNLLQVVFSYYLFIFYYYCSDVRIGVSHFYFIFQGLWFLLKLGSWSMLLEC